MLLAARQLHGQVAFPVRQPQRRNQLVSALPVDLPAVQLQRQQDIFLRGEHGNQIIELIDQPHLTPAEDGHLFSAAGEDFFSIHVDVSGRRQIHAADQVKQGAFGRSRTAR